MNLLCFDLDDTICFPNHEYSDAENKYGKAKPNLPMITAIPVSYTHLRAHET